MKHLNEAHNSMDLPTFEEREFGSRSEFVIVNGNALFFKVQNGPIKENGVNGLQAADILVFCKHLFESLDNEFPCAENKASIHCIKTAIYWQDERTKDRENRGVEGHDKD